MADTGLTGEGFAQGLGSGFLSIWQGIGANFNATAAFNSATAEAIKADASLADDRLVLQDEAEKRQTTTIIVVFVILCLLPILAILLLKNKAA